MSVKLRRFAVLLIAAVAVAVAPVAAASPGSARDTIDDLEGEGYIVHINWLNGFNSQQLDICWVTGVNIPGDTPDIRTTAYVDVRCPNNEWG
jgi:hypothetical protein